MVLIDGLVLGENDGAIKVVIFVSFRVEVLIKIYEEGRYLGEIMKVGWSKLIIRLPESATGEGRVRR